MLSNNIPEELQTAFRETEDLRKLGDKIYDLAVRAKKNEAKGGQQALKNINQAFTSARNRYEDGLNKCNELLKQAPKHNTSPAGIRKIRTQKLILKASRLMADADAMSYAHTIDTAKLAADYNTDLRQLPTRVEAVVAKFAKLNFRPSEDQTLHKHKESVLLSVTKYQENLKTIIAQAAYNCAADVYNRTEDDGENTPDETREKFVQALALMKTFNDFGGKEAEDDSAAPAPAAARASDKQSQVTTRKIYTEIVTRKMTQAINLISSEDAISISDAEKAVNLLKEAKEDKDKMTEKGKDKKNWETYSALFSKAKKKLNEARRIARNTAQAKAAIDVVDVDADEVTLPPSTAAQAGAPAANAADSKHSATATKKEGTSTSGKSTGSKRKRLAPTPVAPSSTAGIAPNAQSAPAPAAASGSSNGAPAAAAAPATIHPEAKADGTPPSTSEDDEAARPTKQRKTENGGNAKSPATGTPEYAEPAPAAAAASASSPQDGKPQRDSTSAILQQGLAASPRTDGASSPLPDPSTLSPASQNRLLMGRCKIDEDFEGTRTNHPLTNNHTGQNHEAVFITYLKVMKTKSPKKIVFVDFDDTLCTVKNEKLDQVDHWKTACDLARENSCHFVMLTSRKYIVDPQTKRQHNAVNMMDRAMRELKAQDIEFDAKLCIDGSKDKIFFMKYYARQYGTLARENLILVDNNHTIIEQAKTHGYEAILYKTGEPAAFEALLPLLLASPSSPALTVDTDNDADMAPAAAAASGAASNSSSLVGAVSAPSSASQFFNNKGAATAAAALAQATATKSTTVRPAAAAAAASSKRK